jgi:hypothetical protein
MVALRMPSSLGKGGGTPRAPHQEDDVVGQDYCGPPECCKSNMDALRQRRPGAFMARRSGARRRRCGDVI